jgi:hypothetical protein
VRHAGRGLVEQQQLGRADECTADLNAAAVNHSQAGDRLEHAISQRTLENLDERARRCIAFLKLVLESAPRHEIEPKPLIETLVVSDHDVVEGRKRQRKTGALERSRHAREVNRPAARICHVGPVEHDLPGIGAVDAGDDIEKRGLAGAVRTDQP